MPKKTDENAPMRVADMSPDELDELISTRLEQQVERLINVGGEVPWPMLPDWPGWPCPTVPGVPPRPPFCPNCLQQMETDPSLFRGAAFSMRMGASSVPPRNIRTISKSEILEELLKAMTASRSTYAGLSGGSDIPKAKVSEHPKWEIARAVNFFSPWFRSRLIRNIATTPFWDDVTMQDAADTLAALLKDMKYEVTA